MKKLLIVGLFLVLLVAGSSKPVRAEAPQYQFYIVRSTVVHLTTADILQVVKDEARMYLHVIQDGYIDHMEESGLYELVCESSSGSQLIIRILNVDAWYLAYSFEDLASHDLRIFTAVDHPVDGSNIEGVLRDFGYIRSDMLYYLQILEDSFTENEETPGDYRIRYALIYFDGSIASIDATIQVNGSVSSIYELRADEYGDSSLGLLFACSLIPVLFVALIFRRWKHPGYARS